MFSEVHSRISPLDDLCQQQRGPDADLTGLGVRIGLYMQCMALSIAAVTGLKRTLTVIPSAIMLILVLNVILAMKAGMHVFQSVPIVQDFWVTQTQLFLLTTIVPFTMLFGRWRTLGVTRNSLALVAIVFTYVQAFWFWTEGYKESDEVVCGTAESELGSWKLFSEHTQWAIVVLYAFGCLVIAVAMWSYVRDAPGALSSWFRILAEKTSSHRMAYRALLLLGLSVPIYVICIWMVEGFVRRGAEKTWWLATGQWLALGIGTFSLVEALWHAACCVRSEIKGKEFMETPEVLGDICEDRGAGRSNFELEEVAPLRRQRV